MGIFRLKAYTTIGAWWVLPVEYEYTWMAGIVHVTFPARFLAGAFNCSLVLEPLLTTTTTVHQLNHTHH